MELLFDGGQRIHWGVSGLNIVSEIFNVSYAECIKDSG